MISESEFIKLVGNRANIYFEDGEIWLNVKSFEAYPPDEDGDEPIIMYDSIVIRPSEIKYIEII